MLQSEPLVEVEEGVREVGRVARHHLALLPMAVMQTEKPLIRHMWSGMPRLLVTRRKTSTWASRRRLHVLLRRCQEHD